MDSSCYASYPLVALEIESTRATAVIWNPSHFTVHVTDVHYSLDRVEQLKLWLKSHNQKLDVILVSGDIANAPMDWTLSDEQLKKYQTDLEAVIDSLSQIKSNVYYIPGNVRNSFTLQLVSSISAQTYWYK